MLVTKTIAIAVDKQVSLTVQIHVLAPGLGDRIHEVRAKFCKDNKTNLARLCRETGVMSRQHWNKIESNQQYLPHETLAKMEKVLGYDFGINRKIEKEAIAQAFQQILHDINSSPRSMPVNH